MASRIERIPTKSIRFYYERDRRSNTMENPKVGAHTARVKSRPHRQTSRAPTMVMMMTDDVFIDEVDQFWVMTINNNFISFLYISLGGGWDGWYRRDWCFGLGTKTKQGRTISCWPIHKEEQRN